MIDNSYSSDFWRGLLEYREETGRLYWKISIGTRIRTGTLAETTGSGAGSVVYILGRTFRSHRVVWMIVHGQWPVGELCHKDHDPCNNRLENLYIKDERIPFKSKSGIKGVHPVGDRWVAKTTMFGVQKHIGIFDTPELASEAYQRARKMTRYEFFRI